jgi:hypothetical protein
MTRRALIGDGANRIHLRHATPSLGAAVNSAWGLLFLLFVPGLIGLVALMGWLEVMLTHQIVADEVANAWDSTDSPDDLEQTIGRILERVVVSSR